LKDSASAVALVVGARMFDGVLADRFPRNRVIVGADLVAGAAQAATAVLLLFGAAQLWHLVVLQAVGGAATAFLLPALNGLVPSVVPTEQRQEANALLGVVRDAMRLAGTAAGGVLVAGLGAGWALGLDASTFFVSALVIARLRLPRDERTASRTFARELAEGWQEFRSRTWMWAISAQFALVNAIGIGSFLVLGPIVAKRTLGGAASWGFILAGEMAGFVIGGVAAMRFRPRRPLLSAPIASALVAPPLLLLAAGASTAPIAAASCVCGAGLALFDVLYMTTLQEQIPNARLSRVSAYALLGAFAPIPIGVTVIGAVSSALGLADTLVLAAAVVVAASLAILLSNDVRSVRRRRSEWTSFGPVERRRLDVALRVSPRAAAE
jgi:MFS family permease